MARFGRLLRALISGIPLRRRSADGRDLKFYFELFMRGHHVVAEQKLLD